ncbi:MAG: SAM-dependent chlorinase/fluorinase [Cyanothece sp. SIO1E1]|nr:SAM-dependent chlorinase/fluorinase [Cyanothece sp. SIO1E1]
MLIHLIADYGVNDAAFAEVTQRLCLFLPQAQIHCLSVSAFNTLSTGFWIAQLGLNPGPSNRVIYHNCAPRKDKQEARIDNEGEGLTYALLPGGVKVVGVWAGYTLSFIREVAEAIYLLKVSRGGSQFRSRDVFPQAVAAIAKGETELLGDQISTSNIPSIPQDQIAWVDGYGNLKTTIPAHSVQLEPMTKVIVRVGDVISDAIYSDGSFDVPEGTLAFAPGSSGWDVINHPPIRWMELFLRGGNAWQRFSQPQPGKQTVTYQVI